MLDISIDRVGDHLVCRPVGELDAFTVGHFRDSLTELGGGERVLIDLSGVPFLDSAGLGALIGSPADPEAVRLMQTRDIDITAKRATQITRQMCLDADMVLVMDAEQRRRLEALYPQVRGRVMTLGHHAGTDIPDPYRQGEAAFREALAQIDQGVAEWLQRIRKL